MKRKNLHKLWVVRRALYKCYDNQEQLSRKFFTALFAVIGIVSVVGLFLGHSGCWLGTSASVLMIVAWNSA